MLFSGSRTLFIPNFIQTGSVVSERIHCKQTNDQSNLYLFIVLVYVGEIKDSCHLHYKWIWQSVLLLFSFDIKIYSNFESSAGVSYVVAGAGGCMRGSYRRCLSSLHATEDHSDVYSSDNTLFLLYTWRYQIIYIRFLHLLIILSSTKIKGQVNAIKRDSY